MDENELLARFGLVPIAADLAEVRGLIEALIADDKRDSNEPLKTLCIQLFSAGIPPMHSSFTKPRDRLSTRDATSIFNSFAEPD